MLFAQAQCSEASTGTSVADVKLPVQAMLTLSHGLHQDLRKELVYQPQRRRTVPWLTRSARFGLICQSHPSNRCCTS